MTYSRSLMFWSVVLFLFGGLLAGWGPTVFVSLAGAHDLVPAATETTLADPVAALTWIGFASVRILGALFIALAVVLFGSRRLSSDEARRVVVQGLAVISGILLAMTAVQTQALLPATAWIAVAVLALMFVDSIYLLRRQGRGSFA